MVEYGNAVSQGSQIAGHGGHAAGGTTDIGAQLGAAVTDALNHASAAVGIPPGILAAAVVIVLLFVFYRVFAR